MALGNLDVMSVGLIAVVAGTTVLVTMVRYDLGPSSRLARGGQWLLATALGTGVLAFLFKLGLIIAVANAPALLIEPVIAKAPVPRPPPADDPFYGALAGSRYVWEPIGPVPVSETPAAVKGYAWQALPTEAPAPRDNPTTAAKAALGERLFHDRDLSRDRTIACSTCHPVREGRTGTDGRPTSRGIDGQLGERNAPTVWNAAFQSVQFWDGRASSLEEQAKGPLVNPLEMGMPSLAAVEERVRAKPDYRADFAQVFGAGRPITIDLIAAAIAAYERTLITPDTPYDRFVRGDLTALAPAQLRGMALFQSLGCVMCHSGPNFSAASLFDRAGRVMPVISRTKQEAIIARNSALRIFPAYPVPYEARYHLTKDSGAAPKGSGRGSWRVPTLRNVALTAPYFHNGAVHDLAEAVRIMASAELGRTGHYLIWSDSNKVLTRLESPTLSETEVNDLVAFLQALSSDRLVAQIRKASAMPPREVTYTTN
jgi:cytochrome c peroxidase